MASKTNFFLGCAVLVLGCVGCDGVDDDDAADFGGAVVQARTAQWNDLRINDLRINDLRINGARLSTSKLYGDTTDEYVQLNGIDVYGEGRYTSGTILGSELTFDGGWIRGVDLIWADFDFTVREDGVTKHKWVTVNDADKVSGTDIWEYDLDLQVGYGPWEPLCLDSNGNPTRAILLADVWNPTTGAKISPRPSGGFTFACKGAALAKCVDFGYRPWASGTLADYHQACTRMVRADYCGNGTSHTVSGTQIHVLDQIGLQNVDPVAQYVVEAEWGPNGAVCLNPDNTRLPNQTIECNIPTCGASFASGGLIQSGKIVQ